MSEIEEQQLELEQLNTRWRSDVTIGFASIGLSTLLLGGVLFAELDRTSKTLGLLGAVIVNTIGLTTAKLGEKNERIKKIVDESALKSIATELAIDQNIDSKVAEINGLQRLGAVVDSVPNFQQPRLIQQFGLHGLTTPTTQELLSDDSNGNGNVITVSKQLPLYKEDVAAQIDTSWMNQNFFYSSGIVTGEEGSGKTQFLAMMALNIINICPDVDLRIHNPHYDWDEDPWFPGMPREIEESLFLTDPEECYRDLVLVRTELKRRITDKDRQSRPIVRICDEFQSVMDSIGKERASAYVDHAQFIKNEGRKYAKKVNGQDTGIRVIFGTHSVKKGVTGIDSSFFNKMVVMLGKSYTDSSAIFPGDFNMKALSAEMTSLEAYMFSTGLMNDANRSLDRARPAIVRVPDRSPGVVAIPKTNLSKLQYREYKPQEQSIDTPTDSSSPPSADHVPNQTWLNDLFVWAHGFSIMPPDEAILKKVFQLTGSDLKPDHLELIKSRLKSFYEL
jgi:hypothetical protein